jgi:hypothetical protein
MLNQEGSDEPQLILLENLLWWDAKPEMLCHPLPGVF